MGFDVANYGDSTSGLLRDQEARRRQDWRMFPVSQNDCGESEMLGCER